MNEYRRTQIVHGAIDGAAYAIIAAFDCTRDEAVDAILEGLGASPQYIAETWRDERDEARAEADLMYREWRALHGEQLRVLIERNAYMQALKDIRADHSLAGVAGAVLYRFGRLYPEENDR